MTAWVIVFSIRCLMKQWTLSICFGEIIVGDPARPFLNLVTWCSQPLLCDEYYTLRKHKCMYCMTNSGSVFLVIFFSPSGHHFHIWFIHFSVWSLMHSSLCSCKIRLLSDAGVECACPAWSFRILWPFQTFTQMLISKKMAADSQVKSTKCTLRVSIGDILKPSCHAIQWWDISNILQFKFICGYRCMCASESFWAFLTCFPFFVFSLPPAVRRNSLFGFNTSRSNPSHHNNFLFWCLA